MNPLLHELLSKKKRVAPLNDDIPAEELGQNANKLSHQGITHDFQITPDDNVRTLKNKPNKRGKYPEHDLTKKWRVETSKSFESIYATFYSLIITATGIENPSDSHIKDMMHQHMSIIRINNLNIEELKKCEPSHKMTDAPTITLPDSTLIHFSYLPTTHDSDLENHTQKSFSLKNSMYEHLLSSFSAVQHLNLPYDKLPIEFIQNVLERDLGDLCLVTVMVNTRYGQFPLVIGGLLMVYMTHWSVMKDSLFSLQKISNVFSISVEAHFRGCGIGSYLLDQGLIYAKDIRQCDEASLEVRATNRLGRRLYHRKGFEEQSEEDEFYEFGADMLDRRGIEMGLPLQKYKQSNYTYKIKEIKP